MSLSVFIRRHHPEIIGAFVGFAKTVMPQGVVRSDAELGDHVQEILTAIGHDLGTPQTLDEQSQNSQGRGVAHLMAASGTLHADVRIAHGFRREAVLAELRVLRATVLRLYVQHGESDLSELVRFNEAVDEAVTESMARFTARTEVLRDQLVGIISHDLRRPLAAITTGAALLAVPEDNPQRRARVTATIASSAQRMERMIGDLLDFTQVKLAGAIPITRGGDRPAWRVRTGDAGGGDRPPERRAPRGHAWPPSSDAGMRTASRKWCRISSGMRFNMGRAHRSR
jgi:signal transduction histidine kinase